MNNKANIFLVVGVVLALILGVWGVMKTPTTTNVIEKIVGASPGPLYTEPQHYDGGVTYGSAYATTSGAAVTLSYKDLKNYDFISAASSANSTWTFFASSTAAGAWLPYAGDTQRTCIQNVDSSYTITFAAGTGIDLDVASSSTADLTINPGNTGCFTFIRQFSTTTKFDISALLLEYTD